MCVAVSNLLNVFSPQGLEVPGQHLKVRFTIQGKTIERAFTPTSKLNQVSCLVAVLLFAGIAIAYASVGALKYSLVVSICWSRSTLTDC